MPPRQIGVGPSSARGLASTRPQDLPERWYAVWEQLVSDMSREAEALPMNTMMALLIERIATWYVRVRMAEEVNGTIDWDGTRSMNGLWLKFHSEFGTQVQRTSQTPDQRFVAGFKAALNSVAREAGPDMTLREFMPLLAQALEPYDI